MWFLPGDCDAQLCKAGRSVCLSAVSCSGTNQGGLLAPASSTTPGPVPPLAHQQPGADEEAAPEALCSKEGGRQGQAEGRGILPLQARV